MLGLAKSSGDERFAWDSYRRFIQMFSKVVLDVDGDIFENAITAKRLGSGAASDADLTAEDLKELVAEFKDLEIAAAEAREA